MKSLKILLLALFMTGSLLLSSAYTEEMLLQEARQEITQEELKTAIPELMELHEVVYPLWHSAYPEKDYALIKELLPQAESLTAKLDAAKLPGILRDKQEAWDKGKEFLKSAFNNLKKAVKSDNKEEMLKQVEAFHAGFERLVRTIRPVVSELEAFHQELYKLYHYHAPSYDIEGIRITVRAMGDKLPPLKQVQLPGGLAEKQPEFSSSVQELESAVNELAEAVKKGIKKAILESVGKVHTAYQKTQSIFD
jgi:CRISPR/Cas system-associated endonuclease Cas3-HD